MQNINIINKLKIEIEETKNNIELEHEIIRLIDELIYIRERQLKMINEIVK